MRRAIQIDVFTFFTFHMRYLCNQMKWFIRKKLAPRLRMTVSPETRTPSPADSRKSDNNDAGDFQEGDCDKDKRNDWKLAAAVIDRVLCIIFSILFVGGTVVFFVTFAIGYCTLVG